MDRYKVIKIDEPDYGCEGLPEGCLMIICMTMISMRATRYALTAEIFLKRQNDE